MEPKLVINERLPLSELRPCRDHEEMLRAAPLNWTDPNRVPGISLGCIWNGKIGMLPRAARAHPEYAFYGWLDIGMHAMKKHWVTFRNHSGHPWPHPNKLALLPTSAVSASHSWQPNCKMCQPWEFCYCFAATTFIVPRGIIFEVEELFYQKMEECIAYHNGTANGYPCLSEQVIMSQVVRERPDLFNWIGIGWGAITAELTTAEYIAPRALAEIGHAKSAVEVGRDDIFDWLDGP